MYVVIKITDKEVLVGNSADGRITRVPLDNAYHNIQSGDSVELFSDGESHFMTKIASRTSVQPSVVAIAKGDANSKEPTFEKTQTVQSSQSFIKTSDHDNLEHTTQKQFSIEQIEKVETPINEANSELDKASETNLTLNEVERVVVFEQSIQKPIEEVIQTNITLPISSETKNPAASLELKKNTAKLFHPFKYLFKAVLISIVLVEVFSVLGRLAVVYLFPNTGDPVSYMSVHVSLFVLLLILTTVVQYKFIRHANKKSIFFYSTVAILYGVAMVVLYSFVFYINAYVIDGLINNNPINLSLEQLKGYFSESLTNTYNRPLWILDYDFGIWWTNMADLPILEKILRIGWPLVAYLWQNFVIIFPIGLSITKFRKTKKV